MSLSPFARRMIGGGIAVVVLSLDALSKEMVIDRVDAPLAVTPFLNIALTFNRGMSYGWFNNGQIPPLLWLAVAVVLSSGLGLWLWRSPVLLIQVALGFIIGGALGNGVDRVSFGAVADFIDVHAVGWHFWTFNLADAAITVGAVLLFFDGLFRKPT